MIIRPHRSVTYVDAAFCYRPNSVVCRSVTVVSPAIPAELTEMSFRIGCGVRWDQGSMYYMGYTLAPPGEYNRIVHVRRRCGHMSKHFKPYLWC